MIRLLLTLFCLTLSYTASAAVANVMDCHSAKQTHSSSIDSSAVDSLAVESLSAESLSINSKSADSARKSPAISDIHSAHFDVVEIHVVEIDAAQKADATHANGNCDCAMKCGCSQHCASSCAATSAQIAAPAPRAATHLAAVYATNVPHLLIPPLFRPPIAALS